jgi:GT2 family glycosyltransferase
MAPDPPELSIIIVSYNCFDLLKECLRSLAIDQPTAEVIVVDNASSDRTAERVAAEFPQVSIIGLDANRGFAVANNIGASAASGGLLLFLNPDTIVRPGAIRLLTAALVGPSAANVGLVGPQLIFPGGKVQPSAHSSFPGVIEHTLHYNFALLSLIRRFTRPDWDWGLTYPIPLAESRTEHLSGAALMTRSSDFELAGGFDERYFLYLEETDLCFAFRQLGLEVLYVPEAIVEHHLGGSSGETTFGHGSPNYLESRYYFLAKNRGRLASSACYAFALVSLALNSVLLEVGVAVTERSTVAEAKRFTARALRWHLINFQSAIGGRSRARPRNTGSPASRTA